MAAHSPCNIFPDWWWWRWSAQQLGCCWAWNSAPTGISFPLLPFLWRRAVMFETLQPEGEDYTRTLRNIRKADARGLCALNARTARALLATWAEVNNDKRRISGIKRWWRGCTGLLTAAFPGHVAGRITWNTRFHLSTPTAPTRIHLR